MSVSVNIVVAPKCWSDTIEKQKKHRDNRQRCLMFMFHSKRTRFIKQLLKDRKKRAPCCTAGTDESNPYGLSGSEVAEEAATAMVQQLQTIMEKRLKSGQLEMLWGTVRTLGKQHSNCVLMPRDGDPHVLFCQFYRSWTNLVHAGELRRLPTCRTAADPVYICVNPYHWSRLLQPETPPPPYSTCTLDRLKPEDRAPSEAPLVFREAFMGSLTTSGDGDQRNPHEWCKLAYWEMARRVGRLFAVESNFVNIFGDAGGSAAPVEGLCLHTLAQAWATSSHYGCDGGGYGSPIGTFQYPNNGCCAAGGTATDHGGNHDAVVTKTRSKVGLGITLSREDNRIWLYNRSDYPIFVNSLALDECNPHSNPILSNAYPIRVHSGYCMCIYDTSATINQQMNNNCSTLTSGALRHGPYDPHSVRVSFVKGWGAHKYSRRDITACPCWLEILLAPCR